MLSRQKVKDTRNRKKVRKREAFVKDLVDNPNTWPCGYCVDDHRDDPTTPDTQIHNTWNSFSARMCRKCQKPKPVESHSSVDTLYYEHISWECNFCSANYKGTERYAQNYAISGSVWNCPECREKFD